MATKQGKRFRLLMYERMWQRWAFPCLFIAPASIALWLLAPSAYFVPQSIKLPIIGFQIPLRPLMLVPALASLYILAYSFLAQRMAWVQCRAGHLRIRTPILPVIISYARIKSVRPSRLSQVFNPTTERAGSREWMSPYWGLTVVVVELTRFPVSKRWLRLWLNRYLFAPTVTGFVLVVDDWMTLSRQITDYRSDWEKQRADRRAQAAEY